MISSTFHSKGVLNDNYKPPCKEVLNVKFYGLNAMRVITILFHWGIWKRSTTKFDSKTCNTIYMSFNGNEGSQITLNDAADLTANYRATILPGDRLALFIGRNRLLDILNQSGCMGVRIYFGLDKNGERELVLVGADSNEDDMEKGVIVDNMIACPPHCGSSNPLNS